MKPDDTASPKQGAGNDPAVDLIRQKIDQLYGTEPNAKKELAEATAAGGHRSKHQQFLYELSSSGKTLADIQTAWHNYYVGLPDNEKHQVWQEFYDEYESSYGAAQQAARVESQQTTHAASHHSSSATRLTDKRSVSDIKQQLTGRVQKRAKLSKREHARSLLFGMGMGAIVIVILLFSFFNERFIAPFITPSRKVSSTPIIIDPNSTVAGANPEIIIPKINVEIPVVYTEPSTDEQAIENALEGGVVHYPNTPYPGETGNGVIFGHSSNNIFNKGKYKFAFVLLRQMQSGDIFILQKDSKRYVYRIYDKKVVSPTDVEVMGAASKPSTFTLITCDPPGTSLNRLVVTGEQISPDPSTNVASKVDQNSASKPAIIPSNSETLWHRFYTWLTT